MWGTAGMGTDYRNATQTPTDPGNMNMVTNLQLMQFGVSVAYRTGGLGVAVTPILQYGALDINYNFMGNSVGEGVAQDLNFGFNLGAYYDFTGYGVDGLTIGAVYKSKIDMEYDNQISNAMEPFTPFFPPGTTFSDHLEQPARMYLHLDTSMHKTTGN
jgi:long-chain fatty acid transport protein